MDRIAMLETIVEKDRENVQAWYMLGEEYLQAGRLADGLYAFSQALGQEDAEMEQFVLSYLKKAVFSLDEASEPKESIPAAEVMTDEKVAGEAALDEEATPPAGSPEPQRAQLTVLEGKHQEKNVSYLDDRRPKRITFEDVGGLDPLKKTIEMKIIKPFANPGLFSKFRKKTGGGILLYGPPGCGKTYIAKATAGEMGANFYPVHISDILNPYFGESERNLHAVFETARANRPAVLFFDEVDTLGYNRSKANSDLMRPLVDSMLTEMESVHTDTDKLLIIGATNMPWDVDSAFKRPGRFDKLVFVPPPDLAARTAIFELKLAGKPIAPGVSAGELAALTEYYSGADIENVIETATENVLTEIMETGQERLIEMEDLIKAVEETSPSTLEWLTTIKNYIKYSNQSGLYSDAARYIRNGG
ncbi:ATP-binding protein [Bacillus marinisedimentorum]|uniref:ATP-binding protein n=1 Tax=Bacillus marinisedimentorum TaxID=1821260 RepID=UPI0008728C44|nr:ATP-binding protein [Bacillus marinisedimentorum]